MVVYKCIRCGFISDRKSSMKYHLSRKNICKPLLSFEKITEEIKNIILSGGSGISTDHEHKIKKLEEEIDGLKQIKKTHTNLYQTNTINFNILLPYKNTEYSFLTDKDYLECINKMILSVPSLIKKIHFNPKHPENHNIYISNEQKKRLLMYNGYDWDIVNHKEIINKLIIDHEFIIEEWLESGESKYPDAMLKFKEYIRKKNEVGVEESIIDEINMLLYNNRDIVKSTKNNLKIL